MLRILPSLLLLLIVAAPLAAQYPANANALRWEGRTSQAGPFCWGFQLTPERVGVLPGETGVLRLRGEFRRPFVIAISPSLGRARTFPGYDNALVLADPITPLWSGLLLNTSPILACPNATFEQSLVVPPSLTPGTTFVLQGVVQDPLSGGGAFTQALLVTVL